MDSLRCAREQSWRKRQFRVDKEQIAFPVMQSQGEIDYPYVYVNPDTAVIQSLRQSNRLDELWANLPTRSIKSLLSAEKLQYDYIYCQIAQRLVWHYCT